MTRRHDVQRALGYRDYGLNWSVRWCHLVYPHYDDRGTYLYIGWWLWFEVWFLIPDPYDPHFVQTMLALGLDPW